MPGKVAGLVPHPRATATSTSTSPSAYLGSGACLQLSNRGFPEALFPGQANSSHEKKPVGSCRATVHTGSRHVGCGGRGAEGRGLETAQPQLGSVPPVIWKKLDREFETRRVLRPEEVGEVREPARRTILPASRHWQEAGEVVGHSSWPLSSSALLQLSGPPSPLGMDLHVTLTNPSAATSAGSLWTADPAQPATNLPLLSVSTRLRTPRLSSLPYNSQLWFLSVCLATFPRFQGPESPLPSSNCQTTRFHGTHSYVVFLTV